MPYYFNNRLNKWGIVNTAFQDTSVQGDIAHLLQLSQSPSNFPQEWGIQWTDGLDDENTERLSLASISAAKSDGGTDLYFSLKEDAAPEPERKMQLTNKNQLILNPDFNEVEDTTFYQLSLQKSELNEGDRWGIEWRTAGNLGVQEAFIIVTKQQGFPNTSALITTMEFGAEGQVFKITPTLRSFGAEVFITDDYVSFFEESIDIDTENTTGQRVYFSSDTTFIGKSSEGPVINLKRVPGTISINGTDEFVPPVGEIVSYSAQDDVIGYDYIDDFSAMRLQKIDDERFVESEVIPNALDKLDGIDGYVAKTETSGSEYYALLASELATIAPDAVKTIDGEDWGDPVRLIPLLIAAIKELKSQLP